MSASSIHLDTGSIQMAINQKIETLKILWRVPPASQSKKPVISHTYAIKTHP